MPPFFKLLHQSKKARLGVVHTAHGDFETPAFMPVGTQATVKTLDPRDLREIGAQIILANAYHLHLRPGEDAVKKMGGLHQFMGWNGPILTDSGGFQVFSLAKKNNLSIFQSSNLNNRRLKDYKIRRLAKIDENGVTFRSHLDGSLHRFTPESATEIQHKLGADIIMAFDQCTSDNASLAETKKAMDRTHEWAERCLKFHQQKIRNSKFEIRNSLFGIIQGGHDKDLRLQSAKFITSLAFDGLAIGGETIGYNMPMTKKVMSWIEPLLPKEKPRYTMGVGFSPADLFAVVEMGVDMFDCVAPTRLARNGALYISPEAGGRPENKYRLNISNSQFIKDPRPIDPWCDCPVCRGFTTLRGTPPRPMRGGGTKQSHPTCHGTASLRSQYRELATSRAYLNHLFRADELLGLRLASIHNVRFMLKLMEEIRSALQAERLNQLKRGWL